MNLQLALGSYELWRLVISAAVILLLMDRGSGFVQRWLARWEIRRYLYSGGWFSRRGMWYHRKFPHDSYDFHEAIHVHDMMIAPEEDEED